MKCTRRGFLIGSAAGTVGLVMRRHVHAAGSDLAWHDVTTWGVGVPQLHHLAGDELLGSDGEGATDGSHPNDLGFLRNSEAYASVLRTIL